MKKLNLNLIEEKLALVFKIILLLYLFSQSLVIFHRTVFVSIALWSMLLIGGIVCCLRITTIKRFASTKGIALLILFLTSYAISIVCNCKYGIREDLANLLILALTIAVVYVTSKEYSKKRVIKEIEIISNIYVVIIDICIIASIVMLFVGYGETWYFEDYIRNIGVVENRLWGVFADPNVAAIFSVVCLLLCFYYIKANKRRWFYIITCILIMLYLAFSDSRTGVVCLFSGVLFVVYMLLIEKYKENKKNSVIKQFFIMGIALACAVCISLVPGYVQKGYNSIIANQVESGKEEAEDKEIKREYDLSKDITNRRMEIWTSGIKIFLDSPIIGVGFHHMQDYARAELPDIYLAKEGLTYSHLHNEIINILVSQGILGFVPILIFAITSIVDVFKKCFDKDNKEYYEYVIGIGCLITICLGIMLNQGILYSYMPINILFWMFLSYMRNSEFK